MSIVSRAIPHEENFKINLGPKEQLIKWYMSSNGISGYWLPQLWSEIHQQCFYNSTISKNLSTMSSKTITLPFMMTSQSFLLPIDKHSKRRSHFKDGMCKMFLTAHQVDQTVLRNGLSNSSRLI